MNYQPDSQLLTATDYDKLTSSLAPCEPNVFTAFFDTNTNRDSF